MRPAPLLLVLSSMALPWTLPVVHVNDIHAHLEPVELRLQAGGPVDAMAGGVSRIAGAVEELRREKGELLLLHAGDEFSGTPWFSLYEGSADAAVLRILRLDAIVPGNHEFDKGPAVLGRFLDSLRAPAVAANLDASGEPALDGRIRSCVVVERSGRKVGIVGIALPSTPGISSPGRSLVFRKAGSAKRVVDSLRGAGVRTVVLLSHAGIDEDTVLARTVPGVSLVVGGHTHTRMGEGMRKLGLGASPPYPVAVPGASGWPVPVVQAWEWGKEIGSIDLELDDTGRVVSWKAAPFAALSDTLVSNGRILSGPDSSSVVRALLATGAVRFPPRVRRVDSILSALSRPLDSLRRSVVAVLPRSLGRSDPELADLCARSYLRAGSAFGAQVGIQNSGGVRDALPAGAVTGESVLRVSPFGNSVVVVRITGAQLRELRRQLAEKPGRRAGWYGVEEDSGGRPMVAGRLLADGDSVSVATNSYLAAGGDGCRVLGRANGFRRDTGIQDAQALADLLREMHPASANPGKDGAKR